MQRGTRLELTELPEDWARAARKIAPHLDPNKLWEEFHRFWVNEPGEKGTKKNWYATWCNRVKAKALKSLFTNDKRPSVQTYSSSPPRTYSEPPPLPQKQPGSPAYREFKDRLANFRATAPRVKHPRFIPFGDAGGFTQVADALPSELADAQTEADREWEKERIAMQQQDT